MENPSSQFFATFRECCNVRCFPLHNDGTINMLISPLETKPSVFVHISHPICCVHLQLGEAARHWVLTCINPLLPGYTALDQVIFSLKDYHRRHGRSSPSLCHLSGSTFFFPNPYNSGERWISTSSWSVTHSFHFPLDL